MPGGFEVLATDRMKITAFLLASILLAPLAALHAAGTPAIGPAAQSLKDFRRVVIADNANAVQRAAAAELASYASKIAGQKIDVLALSKLGADAPGLTFFVGEGAADHALGTSPKPWKTEEWMLRTVSKGLVLAGDDGAGDAWSISTPAGSMLAAYTLLDDHLGVRWFWPGRVWRARAGERGRDDPGAR